MPTRFADLDEAITVTATVIDAETPSDQLKYEWSADSGAFSGTGREVTWRAPAQAATPAVVRLNLAVVETYQTTNSQGLPTTAENRVTGSIDIRLHASAKEVRDMAVEFLVEFSQQRLSPDQIVRNFTDSCPGKRDERVPVRDNQAERTITPTCRAATRRRRRVRRRLPDTAAYRRRLCATCPVRWNCPQVRAAAARARRRHRSGQRDLRGQSLVAVRQRLHRDHDSTGPRRAVQE